LLLEQLKEINLQILQEQAKGQLVEQHFEALAQTVRFILLLNYAERVL
jgi:hypothetical protein